MRLEPLRLFPELGADAPLDVDPVCGLADGVEDGLEHLARVEARARVLLRSEDEEEEEEEEEVDEDDDDEEEEEEDDIAAAPAAGSMRTMP